MGMRSSAVAVASISSTTSAGSSAGSTSVPGSSRRMREVGAGDLPPLVGRLDRLPPPRDLGLRAVDLDSRRDDRGDLLGDLDQFLRAAQRLDRTRDLAACLLDGEVRLRDRQRRVVARRLHVGLPRADNLPRRERGVKRLADWEHRGRPAADEERRLVGREDKPRHVLDLPVVAVVVEADGDVREPHHLRAVERGVGRAEALAGDLDVERVRVRQRERGRQVDGQGLALAAAGGTAGRVGLRGGFLLVTFG